MVGWCQDRLGERAIHSERLTMMLPSTRLSLRARRAPSIPVIGTFIMLIVGSLGCGEGSLGDPPDPPDLGPCGDGTQPSTWFGDGDGDTFGNPDISVDACAAPEGFVANSDDCNDQLATIHPDARDICGDDVDNNCSGADLCLAALEAHWTFSEGTGRTTADATGNGLSGTLNNGATFVPGLDAIHFDGSDGVPDFVEVAHDDRFLLDEGTISLWFRLDTLQPDPNNLTSDIGLWSKDSSGFDNGGHLSFWVTSNGVVTMRLQSVEGATPPEIELASNQVSVDDWHHLAASFGPGGAHLIIDGIEVDSDPYTGGLGATSGGTGNTEPLAIGVLTRNSDPDGVVTPVRQPLTGDIADVRVYNRALTVEDVADLRGLTAP